VTWGTAARQRGGNDAVESRMADDGSGSPTRPFDPAPPELPTKPQVESDATPVEPTLEATEVTMSPSRAPALTLPAHGYKLGRTIGRGGMGEVIAAHDERIGREVAIKRMRNPKPTSEAVTRFLREARIQARLDHPAIVPVHELGVDDGGRPFFTMKRCAGVTLARLLADGGSFHRMLRAFVDVCNAIDFAHSRGVVHRDLKPANIMLGEYGEVYVLDWGVARVLSDLPETPESLQPPEETPDPADSTKSGALLGTPGYIAPEQITGAVPAPSVDIYALGCILFEILACEPLHPRGQHAIGRTLSTPQDSPARRRPDRSIPPELDAACVAALAEEPAERPTVRELGDRVQAYLDGDRDLERRRDLAAQQLAAATAALATGELDARVVALRHAGRALALDPESSRAAELVSGLLLEPPATLPAELEEAIAEQDKRAARHRSRNAIFMYLSIVGLLPLVFLMDVKNWGWIATFYGVVALGIAGSVRNYRAGAPSIPVTLVVLFAIAVLFSRVAGPFVLTPLIICAALAGITPIPWFAERRWVIVAWTIAAVLTPIVLEWIDVLPATWSISKGIMVIQSDVVTSSGRLEEIVLVATSVLFTVTVAILAHSISRRRRSSQLKLFVQAWHLRQLIPNARWQTRPG
jgi:eukaryotic-like serine/threonine-protein kinase